jgi:1,4-dihydroxy-2-naphthoyl-CoA hydrolase
MSKPKRRADVTLDTLNKRGTGRLPGLVGFHVVEVGDGKLHAEIAIRPEILAPNGYLHAASVIGLADTACGYGCLAHLPEGAENFTTIELKCNFLGTAVDGTIECIATPAHLGRTTQVWDATVRHRDTGRNIALFRCTQMILWPKG